MLEVVGKGMGNKIPLCHCYVYGKFNRVLISHLSISKRYSRARKDTEKGCKVNQESAHGEIK